LSAQEQASTVGRLDPNGEFSIFATDTHGTGTLGIDYMGRVIGVERTCSDPGGHPDQCHEPAQLIVISGGNKHEALASECDGKTFWRMGELVCDSKGGVYFSGDNGTYFVNATGKAQGNRPWPPPPFHPTPPMFPLIIASLDAAVYYLAIKVPLGNRTRRCSGKITAPNMDVAKFAPRRVRNARWNAHTRTGSPAWDEVRMGSPTI
jgi:hypothetical protein